MANLIYFQLNGKEKELFPTSSSRSSEPCITKISDTTFALGRECQTVLVNTKGDAETNKVLKWNTQPTVMGKTLSKIHIPPFIYNSCCLNSSRGYLLAPWVLL